jgi:hypothetical protein
MNSKIKNIAAAPFRFILFLFDRALAAAGAIIFAQFPSFIIQYQQRLGGHVDELAQIISRYSEAAARNSRTIEEYISIHLKSEISDFVSSGRIMADNLTRYNELNESLNSLTGSEGLMKLLTFLKTVNYDIFSKTVDNFTPGISFNLDTLLYSATGIIFIMAIYFMIKKLFIIAFESVTGKSERIEK